MADFYLNQLEFDRSFNNIPTLEYNIPNTFDVLDITTISNYFDILNTNNLEVFKNLVVQNPKVFNVNQSNTHFYGLSSTDADSRNDDIPNAKNVYTHIDPFSFDSEWSFVDSIIAGDFLLDSRDNFLYFCSDGTNQYTLRGSFTEFGTLELVDSRPSPIFYIKQDDVDKKIEANKMKPKSSSTAGTQTPESPLSRIGDYDRRVLTEEQKEFYRKQVADAKKFR